MRFRRFRLMGVLLSASIAIACVLPAAAGAAKPGDPTLVTIADGALRGEVDSAHGVRVFKGIPYAAPPVRELRWAAPVPNAGWTGVRDATHFGSVCPQGSVDVGGGSTSAPLGNEDCLFLNVYTPLHTNPATLPVMVWIHGGAWVAGSGDTFDPSVLAPKGDVIVVTINYRIGPLGYLAQRDIVDEATENGAGAFATLDQVAALRWVSENVGAFGGNANKVTIFGESGGGYSVCSLLFAPQAAGLFDRAITQSGPCGSASFKSLGAGLATGDRFTANLGCTGAADVAACLRSKTPAELIAAAPPPGITTGATWQPVIDGVVMPQAPIDAVRSGSFNQVPVIEGTNHDEATIFTPTFVHGLDLTTPVGMGTYQFLLSTLHGFADVPAIMAEYPADQYASPFYSYSAAAGDFYFSCPAYFADQAMSQHTRVYAYEFNDPNSPLIIPSPIPLGAFHGADLLFIQQLPSSRFAQLNADQRAMSDRMVDLWTSFAKTGQPSVPASDWPKFSSGDTFMLDFDPGSIGRLDDFAGDHHCDFWESRLYP
jgi:para-nitrobenzyl esterase